MPKKERIRESLDGIPTREYLMRRIELGWRPAAIEWERDIVSANPTAEEWEEQIPYGLQVAQDCASLVENPTERQVITTAIDMIVEDQPLSRVAIALNERGYTTRRGQPWTPNDLFSLLPRMIQVGPKLFSSGEWLTRRQRLPNVM